jgi:hypothetical protein
MLTRCSIAVLRLVNQIVPDGSAIKNFSQTDPLPNPIAGSEFLPRRRKFPLAHLKIRASEPFGYQQAAR